jgi:hypothetical protein
LGKYREKGLATGTEVFTTYKQRGEWIELLFMTRAAKRGFTVSKPHGDSSRYDVGIEMSGRFKRVQVKGTDCKKHNGYCCTLAAGTMKTYTATQINYFAIYLLEEDLWYIFPATRLAGRRSVTICPHRKKNTHARYREAWDLLNPRKHISIRSAETAEIAEGKVPRQRRKPNQSAPTAE